MGVLDSSSKIALNSHLCQPATIVHRGTLAECSTPLLLTSSDMGRSNRGRGISSLIDFCCMLGNSHNSSYSCTTSTSGRSRVGPGNGLEHAYCAGSLGHCGEGWRDSGWGRRVD